MTQDRYREICSAFHWEVPPRFNIGWECCGRWAHEHERIAMYYEDDAGHTAVYTYRELQQQANRLSNALAGLGVVRGDRVAIVLPQRAETAIAQIACHQMGAVAMPLSVLFGPDAIEYRLQNSEAVIALGDEVSVPHLVQVRANCPFLKHVVGIGEARETNVHSWDALMQKAAARFERVDTAAEDPAILIYTSGTTGLPKGALAAHRSLLGNLPGFQHSQNRFPLKGDVFWSPADWAWTGGLMDVLLPTLYYGQPVLGYKGRFDPEKAFYLMQKYKVTNTFLFPTALKMMMKSIDAPRDKYKLALRSVMSAGEALGETVFAWCRDSLGVTVNEMFGQTEINYIVGNSHEQWPAKPGSMGRPYPGHRVTIVDENGHELPAGETGDVAVNRNWRDGEKDPIFFLGYWKNDEATSAKFAQDWCRTGDLAKMDDDGDLWYQGRADDVFKSASYRIGPSEIENCLLKHPAVANAAVVPSPDAERGNIVKAFIVLTAGVTQSKNLEAEIQDHVRGKLAPYQYPKEIEFIDQLPMTTTGKIQRRELRLREAERKRALIKA
ncbi:MAG: AMP-binding protein [Betaproteobacteria bacterium]|nr:AMP-binding protein [Betaproteobacteria bacterium]